MFGTTFGIGSALLAPASAALAGGPAARGRPGRSSLSLALSGTLHAGALALFLAMWGAPPPEPPGVELRVWTTPPIEPLRQIPPAPPGSAPPKGEGIVTPAGPDIEVIPEFEPDVAPVRNGSGPTLDREVPEGGEAPPAPPARAGDPDLPGLYEEPPVPIHAPEPEYPTLARDAGIEGKFVVEALVGRDGRVRAIRIRDADPILADAARKALQQWRFKPARWNRESVAAWVSIPVSFRLH